MNLKELRIAKGLTQKEVAKAIGISTSYYGMIEIGRRKSTLVIAKKIANFYEKTIDDTFFGR